MDNTNYCTTHGIWSPHITGSETCPYCVPAEPATYTWPGSVTFTPSGDTGWRCPGCDRCYSPKIDKCQHCGPSLVLGGLVDHGSFTTPVEEVVTPDPRPTRDSSIAYMCAACGSNEGDPAYMFQNHPECWEAWICLDCADGYMWGKLP